MESNNKLLKDIMQKKADEMVLNQIDYFRKKINDPTEYAYDGELTYYLTIQIKNKTIKEIGEYLESIDLTYEIKNHDDEGIYIKIYYIYNDDQPEDTSSVTYQLYLLHMEVINIINDLFQKIKKMIDDTDQYEYHYGNYEQQDFLRNRIYLPDIFTNITEYEKSEILNKCEKYAKVQGLIYNKNNRGGVIYNIEFKFEIK